MTLPEIDTAYLLDFLTGLLNTPSPTGMAEAGILYTEQALSAMGIPAQRTHKGGLLASLDGQLASAPRAMTAHVDTLGAMVKAIKPNGRLKLTQLGGYAWNSIEGEGCTVFTAGGHKIRGSILLDKASVHIYGKKVSETPRDEEVIEVRIDERTVSQEQTRALGIEVGDFVSFDPRVEVVNGFVRSRHLDDKACVACILAAVKALHEAGLQPVQTTHLFFSNYEETGHGAAAGIPAGCVELLTVDMAAAGEGQNSDEYHASLCVKDSGGPYHHGMSQRLRHLAGENDIDYRVDVYPYYGSDGESLWRAGGDLAVALIGPGVDASHSYERTHLDALVATARWILAYLLN
ncbi:MAG: M42 family metallopeptidase [Chloroflexi bacterium]|nr:M42 family metallopeptidase [Chloroflexota bacterium]